MPVYIEPPWLQALAGGRIATWVGDYSHEPTLFWRGRGPDRNGVVHEVHIVNRMPSREFREQYGVKPAQEVEYRQVDASNPNSRPSIRHVENGTLNSYDQFRDHLPKPPTHVQRHIQRAIDTVTQHAQNHGDLFGQLAEQGDIGDDLRRVPRDMADEERGRQMYRNLRGAADGDDDNGRTGSQRLAYGEIKSPPDVDTLRDEACPICGNDSAYAGRECQICGYILPIKPFADPDVDKARQLDQLRQTVDDQLLAADPSRKGAPFEDDATADPDSQPPALACPNCGETVEPEPPQTTDAPGVASENGPAAGDPCPNCGEAELEPVELPTEEDEPDADELDQDCDQLPDDDEQDDNDKSKSGNPASPKKKTAKLRTSRTDEGDPGAMTSPNPGLQALAAQQRLIESLQENDQRHLGQIQHLTELVGQQATQIERLTAGIATLAQLGGAETLGRVKIAMIRKKADEQNPAQPVPEPAPQPPTQTTPQAKTPEAFADVTAPGMVPGTTQDVAADAVTTTYTPGQDIASAPFHQLVDVTAPVDGTQGPRPINEVRTETDVRVGNPMNPQVAFPIGGPFANAQRTIGNLQAAQAAQSTERFTACLRLARLQLQAGVAEGEDVALAQRYARDVENMPDAVIASNIQLLGQLQTTASRPTAQPPRSLVPRTAGMGAVQRTVSPVPMMAQASVSGGGDDDLDINFIGLDLD